MRDETTPDESATRAMLPVVRRLEAVGFRAWPAASTYYDGSWLVRLTPGHGSRRLNSVNPLDPSDSGDMERRLDRAAARFSEMGRGLTVRQTPLAAKALCRHLDERGWSRFAETIVMTADIPPNDTTEAIEHLPLRDVSRFVDARLAICGEPPGSKAALAGIIEAIRTECGMFLFEERGRGPTAVALAVHDNDLAGLQQVAVSPLRRREGIGSDIVNACLRWARLRGATKAWLAVEAENVAAIALYRAFGFREVYRYLYRQPGKPS